MGDQDVGRTARGLGVGALVGVSAGVLLGLLIAPEEGSRLRRRISFHLEGLYRQVRDLVDKSTQPTLDNEARRTGQALVSEVEERAQEIHNRIDTVLGEMPDRGSN